MFIVMLRFAANKALAGQFMEGHKSWIRQGFADGVFLLTGSLLPGVGGGILAHNSSLEALHARVEADPFVAEGVVDAEIIELSPALADERLQFLVG
ncbi:hypothetical protein AAFN46_12125 [Pseudomonas sp. CAU 1711]|uniref:YciI family protein n=1 Tax=Pseudomonas sp. CAU 1711 TaxID=3140356 RepID=UPI00325FF316